MLEQITGLVLCRKLRLGSVSDLLKVPGVDRTRVGITVFFFFFFRLPLGPLLLCLWRMALRGHSLDWVPLFAFPLYLRVSITQLDTSHSNCLLGPFCPSCCSSLRARFLPWSLSSSGLACTFSKRSLMVDDTTTLCVLPEVTRLPLRPCAFPSDWRGQMISCPAAIGLSMTVSFSRTL